MILKEQHIEYIENNLKFYGVTSKELKEDLIDHICAYIEASESNDFETLYQEAIQKFGGYACFQNLQLETNYQTFTKQIIKMNKAKFFTGFIVILLLVVSLIFQMMHWPYANAWLIGAISISVLVVLPMQLYINYKKNIHKLS